MDLFCVHAFAVSPQRLREEISDPHGGRVSLSLELKTAIEENFERANFIDKMVVDFDFDTSIRTNEMRELILSYGFASDEDRDRAAADMAQRLANSMDRRSSSGLFVVAAGRESDARQVTLWIFPRDSAFQFREGEETAPTIEVLRDIFSQTSRLRKAALFEGRHTLSDFISGHVLDFQADKPSLTVADFWIKDFLQCCSSIGGDTGTRHLAKNFRAAFGMVDSPIAREQLFAAVVGVRASPRQRVSMRGVADQYLSGEAHRVFLENVSNDAAANSLFIFQREKFDASLKFRIFELNTGVIVTSPFGQVGETVTITGEQQSERELNCSGRIVGEKLRTRYA